MLATELLRHDHDAMKALFDRLDQCVGYQRQVIIDEIEKALEAHTRMEEEIFYVAVRESDPSTKPLIDLAVGEHTDVADLLEEIEKLDVDDEEWEERVAELRENVLTHIEMEESRIFAEAHRVIDGAELERIAEDMERMRASELSNYATRAADLDAGAGLGI